MLGQMMGAAGDLGLGGMLRDQVQNETEEERKKRMAQLQESQTLGPDGSLAVNALFGSRGMNGAY
jgi:hypothetical protein